MLPVDDIHQNVNAHAVRGVYQLLEIIWCTKSTGYAEGQRDVIPEAPIVSMLRNSHDLHAVIAKVFDPRQHVLCEFFVRMHSRLNACHANMALVDLGHANFCRSLVLERIPLRRVPKDAIKRAAAFLVRIADPGWYTVFPLVFGIQNVCFDLRLVRNGVFSYIFCCEEEGL